ncbi:MAG TPA: peptidylprolyl isomerase [Bryobacteraceae bacterium]|nr:peptidylprolyl isomerase [Bryobacteraceae bacterium]
MLTRFLGYALLLSAVVAGQGADPRIRMKVTQGDAARTPIGDIEVTLLQSVAPLTVANFLKYMNRGSFNNMMFHRLVSGFVLQGGGWTYTEQFTRIASDGKVRNEYNISNTRGTLAMAKVDGDPNSATTEWFFNLADNSANLNTQNGGFTVFGRVSDASLPVLDKIVANSRVTSFSMWDSIPLYNYRIGTPQAGNIVIIPSFQAVDTLPTPAISDNGVVSNTTFGGGQVVARGSHIEIFGSNLAGTTRSWTTADMNGSVLPTTVDNVKVTFGVKPNERPGYVIYVSPNQVNVQVPEDAPLGDAVPVVLNYNGYPTSAVNVAVRETAGGILAPPSFKVGERQYVVAQRASGQLVSGGNIPDLANAPAVPGETLVLYGVGLGDVTPGYPLFAGRIAQGQTTLNHPVSLKVGDFDAKVTYQGLAPNFVGLYQINFEVPSAVPAGDQKLTISQRGEVLPQELYLPVKAQ